MFGNCKFVDEQEMSLQVNLEAIRHTKYYAISRDYYKDGPPKRFADIAVELPEYWLMPFDDELAQDAYTYVAESFNKWLKQLAQTNGWGGTGGRFIPL